MKIESNLGSEQAIIKQLSWDSNLTFNLDVEHPANEEGHRIKNKSSDALKKPVYWNQYLKIQEAPNTTGGKKKGETK